MNIRNWLFSCIAVLALIGLGSFLFMNPSGLLKQLLFMGIAVAAIYSIYRIWIRRKPNSNESRSFAKAAKLSNKRNSRTDKKSISQSRKKPLRKRSAAHLTVIEGKKGKKKDRAIF